MRFETITALLKSLGSLLLLLASLNCIGQNSRIITNSEYNTSGAIRLGNDIEEARRLAQLDIEKGIPFLNLVSGFSPQFYEKDKVFEQQFEVYYYEHGCVGPSPEVVEAYNKVIFDYLQAKYGNSWRRLVRKDVASYKTWKKIKRP
jgi:hypothetical protein